MGVHRLGVPRSGREIAANRCDPVTLDQQITRRIEPAFGIEEPGAAE